MPRDVVLKEFTIEGRPFYLLGDDESGIFELFQRLKASLARSPGTEHQLASALWENSHLIPWRSLLTARDLRRPAEKGFRLSATESIRKGNQFWIECAFVYDRDHELEGKNTTLFVDFDRGLLLFSNHQGSAGTKSAICVTSTFKPGGGATVMEMLTFAGLENDESLRELFLEAEQHPIQDEFEECIILKLPAASVVESGDVGDLTVEIEMAQSALRDLAHVLTVANRKNERVVVFLDENRSETIDRFAYLRTIKFDPDSGRGCFQLCGVQLLPKSVPRGDVYRESSRWLKGSVAMLGFVVCDIPNLR